MSLRATVVETEPASAASTLISILDSALLLNETTLISVYSSSSTASPPHTIFLYLVDVSFHFSSSLLATTSPTVNRSISPSLPHRTLLQNGTVSSTCPLKFDVLRRLAADSKRPNLDTRSECQYIRQGLRLVQSEYLRLTNSFLPPLESAESCWDVYESLVNEYVSNFNIRSRCGFQTPWIARGCMNTRSSSPPPSTTKSPPPATSPLLTTPPAPLVPLRFPASRRLISRGPQLGTSPIKKKKIVIAVVVVICGVVLLLCFSGFWLLRRRRARISRRKWSNIRSDTNVSSGLESISASTTLIRFTFDEIKEATKNFSRENIIGKGGYGNVYKGALPDGSEVALKRFKNCSAAGDASFTHEVEVIASVRHVNLVALRGYCTATTPLEGHQRIIVCDLMKNGSLHDHLFGLMDKKLSWPTRQKVALGTARG
ncbi:UNVERIFIED_CONTAM: putative LRR receptor-like serine/threonine-protein kinase RKF3 [Sesamum angustifolium]|uniref:LRR receptor-like serine/threonine-protein kinase RKF3 n=1 Tax=Sesamum angustifolium TaxID=2727405 RepID=A0AAW2QUH5_9LAMI